MAGALSPIGVFDSGVGGISVLAEMERMLPHEDFVYFGDTLHAPYGTKPEAEVLGYVRGVMAHLAARDVKAVVIACNTATSVAAARLREELTLPIIGMEPALKPAHELRHGGQILVLATPATLHMDKFLHLMELYGEGAVPVEGYGIVECVEDGQVRGERILSVLHGLLDEHLKNKTDAIVLGCTHYPLIREVLAQVAPGVPLIDGNLGTVRQLRRVLERDGLLCPPGEPGGYELHTTGDEAIYLPRMRLLMDLAPTT